MNRNVKKLFSVAVIVGVALNQTACVSKTTNVYKPLDKVKFPQDYTYVVKLKTEQEITKLQTENLDVVNNELIVSRDGNKKSLTSQDIKYIYGQSNVATKAGLKFVAFSTAVGLGAGLALGFMGMGIGASGRVFGFTLPVFGIAGFLVGLMGANSEDRPQILITPTAAQNGSR